MTFSVRPLSRTLGLPRRVPESRQVTLGPGQPGPGFTDSSALHLADHRASCQEPRTSHGLEPRPKSSLGAGKPAVGGPGPAPGPAPPPRGPTVAPRCRPRPSQGARGAPAPAQSPHPDRDGGRFGVAAARGAVGRSRCAVDRAQRPEFGGNSADTPPAWPEAASRGRYRSSRPIPLECLAVSRGRVRSS